MNTVAIEALQERRRSFEPGKLKEARMGFLQYTVARARASWDTLNGLGKARVIGSALGCALVVGAVTEVLLTGTSSGQHNHLLDIAHHFMNQVPTTSSEIVNDAIDMTPAVVAGLGAGATTANASHSEIFVKQPTE